MTLAIEHTLIHDLSGGGSGGVVADGRPGLVLQVDVGGQNGVQGILALVDGLGEPGQLGGGADHIGTVSILGGLGGGNAVPGLHVSQHLSLEGVFVGLDGGLHLGSGLSSAPTGDAVLGAFLGNGVLQIEAAANVVRGVRAGGQASQIRSVTTGAGDGGDAVAVGQGRAVCVAVEGAADTAQIALVGRGGGDITAGIAVGDDRTAGGVARDAAGMLLGVDVDGAVAVLNGGAALHVTHDTASFGVAFICAGHIAGNTQIQHLGAALQIAEDTQRVAGAVDVQVLHHVAIAIESAVELVHGRPVVTGQVDVGGQLGAGAAAVGGKPGQLGGGRNLIDAAFILCRLSLSGTVPSLGTGDRHDGGLDGQDIVLHLAGVSAAQREGAAGQDIAVFGQGIGVGAITQGVGAVLVGGDGLTVAAQQGDGHAVHGIAAVIGDVQLDGVGGLLIDRDHRVGIVAQVVRDGNGVEVGAHTGIGHVVQEREGVGGGVHGAEGVTVGKGVLRGGSAVGKGHILGDGDGDGGAIHLLILTGRTLKLVVTGVIGGLEGGGVEHAGDLVDRTVHAVKGQLHLVTGHDGLAGVGDVLGVDRDLGHAHQTVADTGLIGHPDDDGTAHAVAGLVEGGQRHHILTASIGGNAGEVGGDLGGHAIVGGDKSVFHIDAASSRDSEVQSGVRLVGLIEPGIVVIIPVHGAGGGGAGSHVELHLGVGGAVDHAGAAYHDDAHALRVGGGEQAAVGAVIAGIHIHAVIVDSDDGVLCTGGDIRPVGTSIAAVDRADRGVAGQLIPVEVRLHHDVAGVGVDELPVTVGADTGGAGEALVAAGIQIDLQVGLVALAGLGTQLAEIVRNAVGGRVLGKGEGQLAVLALAGQPARLGHMGIIAETPGVVALGDEILSGLGAVAVIRPAVGIGQVFVRADRRDFRGVEVVPLEVQAEGSVGGNRDIQRDAGIDRQRLGSRAIAGLERLVDVLGEDIAFDIRIGVGIVQAGVASRVQHGGIVGIIALDIGIAHGGAAAHDGAVHADMILICGEIGIVRLSAGGIEGDALQVDAAAAACAAVHVLIGGQVQGHAAQRHIIVAGIGVLGKGTVGIASGLQLGVEHLVVADQLAHGGIVLVLTLGQSAGEVAVQEHVFDLIAQHFIAVGVLFHIVQLDDGIEIGGAIVVVSANIEAEFQRGSVLHGQGQRPGVLREVHTVVGGIKAVHIGTGRQLGDLDGGHTEDGLGEIGPGAPGLAAIGGALIVVVLVVQLLALGRLKDLAGLQIAQQIGRAGLDGGAGLGGIAGLAGGNGHGLGLGRGLVAVGRGLVAAGAGIIGGSLVGIGIAGAAAFIGIAGTAVVGGIGVLVGVGGGILSVVGGDGLRGLRYVIRPGGYRRVSHQGERHGQRQQKRKQSFAFFHALWFLS